MATALVGGVLLLLGLGYLVWLLLALWMARGFAEGWRGRMVAFVMLAGMPVACNMLPAEHHEDPEPALRKLNVLWVDAARAHLSRVCQENRVQIPGVRLKFEQGIRIQMNASQGLSLLGAPRLEPDAPVFKERQQLFGDSYPRMRHDHQYVTKIYWVKETPVDRIAKASRAAFVEYETSSNSSSVNVSAPKSWWLSVGRDHVDASMRSGLDKILQDRNGGTDSVMTWGSVKSTARYILSTDDISTLEDRRHWVARGRLQLTDSASGTIVAEYVGFLANSRPAYSPGSVAWLFGDTCAGPEGRYSKRYGYFDVFDFFFSEVARGE